MFSFVRPTGVKNIRAARFKRDYIIWNEKRMPVFIVYGFSSFRCRQSSMNSENIRLNDISPVRLYGIIYVRKCTLYIIQVRVCVCVYLSKLYNIIHCVGTHIHTHNIFWSQSHYVLVNSLFTICFFYYAQCTCRVST